MKLEVLQDASAAAQRAAEVIALAASAAIAECGRFVMAVSGGRSPWVMLRHLATLPLDWPKVFIVQVDERIAPAQHADRNLTHLRASLAQATDLPPENVRPMPVEGDDLASAAAAYEQVLHALAGTPPVLDLAHLGLGADGHTASLVPGDPVLEESGSDVALTAVYQGRRRMTLTYPVLSRARRVLWLVTGQDKADMLARLLRADTTIPAGRVNAAYATVIADVAARGEATSPESSAAPYNSRA